MNETDSIDQTNGLEREVLAPKGVRGITGRIYPFRTPENTILEPEIYVRKWVREGTIDFPTPRNITREAEKYNKPAKIDKSRPMILQKP